jgi:GT2 family glycosyltransferase
MEKSEVTTSDVSTSESSLPAHRLEQRIQFLVPTGFRLAAIQESAHFASRPLRVTHPDSAIKVSLEPTGSFPAGWYRLEIRFPPEGVVDVIAQLCCADGSQLWYRLTAIERNFLIVTMRIGRPLMSMVLRITGSGYLTNPLRVNLKRLDTRASVAELAGRARRAFVRRGLGIVRSAATFALELMRPEPIVIPGLASSREGEMPYDTWMRMFDETPEPHRQRHEQRLRSLKNRPLISCLARIRSLDALAIARLAQGMRDQIYSQWELIIAVPDGLASLVGQALLSNGLDRRLFRMIVGSDDVSSTLNALLNEATGEYVLQIPSGALVRPNTLLELAMTLTLHPAAELVYSDEDRIDENGRRHDPKFKPAWSPDFFTACNYIGDVTLFRRQTVLDIGGWQPMSRAALDHDLKLRVTDQVESQRIIHLAKVLVSCPATNEQSASDGRAALGRMLDAHIKRRGFNADAIWRKDVGLPRLRYRVPVPPPTVSLIIPTRDRADLLEACMQSVLKRTLYDPIEVLIVDNGSTEDATHRLFAKLRSEPAVRVLRSPGPFNYSALNNLAAQEAKGAILGLLNNDIEVTHSDWLDEMVALVVRPEIGCVGAKLLYPDRRIQHAGVYLGVGKLASHAYHLADPDAVDGLKRVRTEQNVSAVTAACLLVRKRVFEEVGGFDEKDLQITLNDLDFCLKVRMAGYLNLWTPFAELIHHESASRGRHFTPTKAKRMAKERSVIYARWGAQLFCDPYYSPNLTCDYTDASVRVH